MADTIDLVVKSFTAIGALATAFVGVPMTGKAYERRLGKEVVANTLWFSSPLAVATLTGILCWADVSAQHDSSFLLGSAGLFVLALFIACVRRAIFRPWGLPRRRRQGDGLVLFIWIMFVAGLETLWWAAMIDAGNAWGIFDKLSRAVS